MEEPHAGDQDEVCFDNSEEEEELVSNVLVVFHLPRTLDHDHLQEECACFGELKAFKFVPLLAAAVVVFLYLEDAIECKLSLQNKYNCGFGKPISDEDLHKQQLNPPANMKAFLISPPTSPPPDWKPRTELPPTQTPDDELMQKLTTLLEGSDTTPAIILERDIDEEGC